MSIQLKINGPRGEEIIIDLCDREDQMKRITVLRLKKKISERLGTNDDIRMIFRTEQLEESKALSSYGIRHMSTIHAVLRYPGGI